MEKHTVYLGACPDYRPARIADVIRRGFTHIHPKIPLAGHVVIKPNLVMAHTAVAPEGYTRKELLDGLLQTLPSISGDISRIDIVEKSGLGVTTSSMFKNAGYHDLRKKYGVGLRSMEEGPQIRVILEHGTVHDQVTVAREMAFRDFLIFTPKLKSNVLSHGLSAALKLNIGTIDSRERLHKHHHELPAKIVDLLEIANPDLIVTDGIRMAFGGNQMTEHGTPLGVIVMAANAVAHDIVCAHLMNLNPDKIEHICEAVRRGYGPASLKDIEITGDFPVEKARTITKSLDLGFRPVHDVDCPLSIHSGNPYCTGGCHGIFLDWLYMIRDRKPRLFERLPAMTVLIGKVEKAVEDRRIVMIGNCAAESSGFRGRRVVRIRGCPPSHKRIVWDMLVHFLIFNPLVRPELIIDAYVRYPFKKIKGWLINLGRGKPVHRSVPSRAGAAHE